MVRRVIVIFIVIVAGVVLAACDSSQPKSDATPNDGINHGDASASAGVACGDPSTECSVPDQVCCDVTTGTDQCVMAGGNCAGVALSCDGPEDCPSTQECCLFSDRSQCLNTGICGTTGSITEVMCHVDGDCDLAGGEHCCGTAPGPAVDVYGVCRVGACPQ